MNERRYRERLDTANGRWSARDAPQVDAITTDRHAELDRVARAVARVVAGQPVAQATDLDPRDRIAARIVRRGMRSKTATPSIASLNADPRPSSVAASR